MSKIKYELIKEAVDAGKEMVYAAEKYIWEHPETGYKEVRCSQYMAEKFIQLGYKVNLAGDIPGFYADYDTGREGPCVLVLGELDALICAGHPDADPITGAVHACGHNAQSAGLLALAAALKYEPKLTENWCGRVRLCAVPAEELVELDFRESLRKKGVIKYYGGKVEFWARGYFDGVDMALMLHTSGGEPGSFFANKGNNGCMVKYVSYIGKAVHASCPHGGTNALTAATLGIQAINSIRETLSFSGGNSIRIHPIITEGGTTVNIIPDLVKIENYVRGSNMKDIIKVANKVNRAMAAGAMAVGAKVKLMDRPGYFPLNNDPTLLEVAIEAMKEAGKVSYEPDDWSMGCTDMGDLSSVIPSIQPFCSGAAGAGHGVDYRICDVDSACLNSAKSQFILLDMLLENEAAQAYKVIENAKPLFKSKEEYFNYVDGIFADIDAVTYEDDGTITVKTSK